MAQGKDLKRVEGTQNAPVRRSEGVTPFSFMRRMMDDIDQLFGFETTGLEPRARAAWAPELEVFEKNGNLVVRADLPGLDRKDVKVNVEEGVLTIEGERREEKEEEREGYYHSERSYGSFQRRIPLPRGADPSTCDAKFDNGVLEIQMKLPKQSGRSIEIKGGERQGERQIAQQTQPQSQRSQPQNGTQASR